MRVSLIEVKWTTPLQVDTILRCNKNAEPWALPGYKFDLYSTRHLLAIPAIDTTGHLQESILLLKYDTTEACLFDTVTTLAEAYLPQFTLDGSGLLADHCAGRTETMGPSVCNFLIYDIAGDSAYSLLPSDKWRVKPQAPSVDGPFFYETTHGDRGIWMYGTSTGEVEVLSVDTATQTILSWLLERDSLSVSLGTRIDTGYVEIRRVFDIRTLQSKDDTCYLGTTRPVWSPWH